jgi:hypothetical protein
MERAMIIVLPTSNGGYLIGMEPDPTDKPKRRRSPVKKSEVIRLHTAKRHLVQLRRWMRLSHRYAN